MDFDRFSVALLVLREDPPLLSESEAAELQDNHMAHLADLHEAGQLLAAGPLTDAHFRGLMILSVDESTARRLLEEDRARREVGSAFPALDGPCWHSQILADKLSSLHERGRLAKHQRVQLLQRCFRS